MRKIFVALLMIASLAAGSSAVFAADSTIDQVYAAASAGKFGQAQQMMDQVLRDHPNSGKAHFVEAELLAKQGRIAGAKNELSTAERLAPGLPFAKPAAVQELKSLLVNDAPRSSTTQFVPQVQQTIPASYSSVPWGLIAIVLAMIALVVFFFNRRSNPTVIQTMPSSGPNYGGGFGNSAASYGAPPMPMAPAGGMGSGILGSLATGAAVGAGVVAGEALMHRVLDGGTQSSATTSPVISNDWNRGSTSQEQNYDMGGNDFGLNDDSSWDDSSSSSSDDDWN
jgi:hypothetical protein